jgi:hypothetical protein
MASRQEARWCVLRVPEGPAPPTLPTALAGHLSPTPLTAFRLRPAPGAGEYRQSPRPTGGARTYPACSADRHTVLCQTAPLLC